MGTPPVSVSRPPLLSPRVFWRLAPLYPPARGRWVTLSLRAGASCPSCTLGRELCLLAHGTRRYRFCIFGAGLLDLQAPSLTSGSTARLRGTATAALLFGACGATGSRARRIRRATVA